jgi:hypothetical protein
LTVAELLCPLGSHRVLGYSLDQINILHKALDGLTTRQNKNLRVASITFEKVPKSRDTFLVPKVANHGARIELDVFGTVYQHSFTGSAIK